MNEGFFIYRFPDEREYHAGKGKIINKLRPDSFAICPFSSSDYPNIILSNDETFTIEELENFEMLSELDSISNIHHTDKTNHTNRIQYIINHIENGEKCVASRIYLDNRIIDLKQTFLSFANHYSNAMVYCFYSPYSGLWMGATPELLLKSHDNIIESMALAGTRLATMKDTPWDPKNLEEQQIVTDYIVDLFEKKGLTIVKPLKLQYCTVGKLQHLQTIINATASSEKYGLTDKFDLAEELSPTPAVSGYPRNKAINIIKKIEKFNREYYGGFCGPVDKNGNLSLYVILRSIRIYKDGFKMYAGGGITPLSIPELEWEETENKIKSITDFIIYR